MGYPKLFLGGAAGRRNVPDAPTTRAHRRSPRLPNGKARRLFAPVILFDDMFPTRQLTGITL